LSEADLVTLGNGGTLSSNSDQNINPDNITDLCFDKAANFRFDVTLDEMTTSIPTVFYDPIYEIKLFPNPNEGVFNLSINVAANQFIQIEIFDAMGRKIYEENRESYNKAELIPIQLNTINSGIHFVKIRVDQEVLMKKFISRKK